MNTMGTRKVSYYDEIARMMFGFGDSHEPNPETVRLVESIVLKQLRTIINEALKYWDGKVLKGEDLVFLLRHNKYKMQRYVRYLKHVTVSKKLRTNSAVIEIDPDEIPRNKLLDFIEKIDETGEFMDTSEIDEVKMDRLIRADSISQDLNEKKYFDFHKARCASFKGVGASTDHLRLWIDPKEEIKFKVEALEVLAYFAYQTVAEMTDFALFVREDTKAGSDPFRHLPGNYYTATMFNRSNRFPGILPNISKIHSGQTSLTVNEIKEVMRRVYNPQAGRLNFGGKVPDTHYMFAL